MIRIKQTMKYILPEQMKILSVKIVCLEHIENPFFRGEWACNLKFQLFSFKLDSFKIKIPFSIANICLSYVIRKMNKVLKLPHEKKTPHETNFTFFICICSKNQIWNWRQNASFRWNSQIAMIE